MSSPASSTSLTDRSTDDMELDASPMGHSPLRSGTPGLAIDIDDNDDSLIVDEKHIVVDAPSSGHRNTAQNPSGVARPALELSDSDVLASSPSSFDEDEPVYASEPAARKRKYNKLPQYTEDSFVEDESTTITNTSQLGRTPPQKRAKAGHKVRGCLIGVWRDSSEHDDAEKHVIYGFIDVHDRLRTRIYGLNRRGEDLVGNVPTGAGGCWVTFERIIFDTRLKECSAAEVKEYVKLRSEISDEGLTGKQIEDINDSTIVTAKAVVAASENASPGVNRAGAVRTVRGPYAPRQNRQPLPRARMSSSSNPTPSGFQPVNAGTMPTPIQSPSSDPRSNPGSVLLGYWLDSSEVRDEDKHAVYGVLSGTDCFRVKVQRITRDGRYVDGNFPVGAGALWLHYDKVQLDDHLQGLDRAEIKEYCRIRQSEQQKPETPEQRRNNELDAVRRAKMIVRDGNANGSVNGTTNGTYATDGNSFAIPDRTETPTQPSRHSSRSEQARMASLAEVERVRKTKEESLSRQQEKTRKEVAIQEAALQEAAQMELKHNIKNLNRVWLAQRSATAESTRASSIPAASVPVEGEVKYHNGIKYERKATGPFAGKLVGAAQIISIDGDDFVEYRVLTKPSFF